MPDPPATEFDAHSAGYRDAIDGAVAFSGADHAFFTRAKARSLLELSGRRVGDPRGLRFCDIGCGPGETDRMLGGRVGSLLGLDVSAKMVEVARALNPWATYETTAAGASLPVGDGEVDVAFAICVLHHVPLEARASLMSEMVRITRPGGLVAIYEHNPLNPLTRRAVAGCEFDRDAVLLGRREAERLLTSAGLRDPQASYVVFFTRQSRMLHRVERALAPVPLGAQYVVSATR